MMAFARRQAARAARRFTVLRADRVPRPEPVVGALGALRMVASMGLATGLAEVVLLGARNAIDRRVTPDLLRMNDHHLWMIPVANLALFGIVGLLIAPWTRSDPKRAGRAAQSAALFLAAMVPLLLCRFLHPLACVALACGVAARGVPWVEARWRRSQGLVARGFWPLCGVLGLLVAVEYPRVKRAEAHALAALPRPRPGLPNVLLIVMDTVRADHLSTFGLPRPTSPFLTRLAGRGVKFNHARSTAPWTLPSHASLFTGRWPHELSVDDHDSLDATYPTLAEFLSRHGYASAGFAANTYYCNARFGLDRGFGHYEDYDEKRVISCAEILRCSELGRKLVQLAAWTGLTLPFDHTARKSAAKLNRDFLGWIEGRDTSRPFFAFLNYYDVHDPYLVPDEFDRHLGRRPTNPEELTVLHRWATSSKRRLTDSDIELARDAYDDCIAYLDEQLGRLFDELERSGVLQDTLVIITSDHGESWGEHQLFGHWRSLYRSETHVPLVIVGPSRVPAGAVIDEPVSLRDVAATIADLTGLRDASAFPGRSLARFWTADTSPADPPVIEVKLRARDDRGRALALMGPRAALVVDGKLYIQNGSGREELYDLVADPDEAHNLAAPADARAVLEPFRAAMKRLVPDKAIRR
jgi:arylsulfatase A-like enzyme